MRWPDNWQHGVRNSSLNSLRKPLKKFCYQAKYIPNGLSALQVALLCGCRSGNLVLRLGFDGRFAAFCVRRLCFRPWDRRLLAGFPRHRLRRLPV